MDEADPKFPREYFILNEIGSMFYMYQRVFKSTGLFAKDLQIDQHFTPTNLCWCFRLQYIFLHAP